jgi:serine/threonine protein phosphatase PrpC
MELWNGIKDLFKGVSGVNKRKLSSEIRSFGGSEEGLSIQGASHVKHDKVCQDYGGHYRCDEYAVAVVCDGHGSDAYFRSDRGSRFGVQVMLETVGELMLQKENFLQQIQSEAKRKFNTDEHGLHQLTHEQLQDASSDALNQLIKTIIVRWNVLVSDDMKAHPFTEEELAGLSEKRRAQYAGNDENDKFSAYGTTLIAVVYAPEFWFGIRNGDGKCVCIGKDGTTVKDPIPWNEKCFLNATTSLCDSKALENFRKCFYMDDFPASIYVGTDGVDDSYGTDESLFRFYQLLTQSFAQNGFEGGKKELRGFLPTLTAKGSGDDISISGIVDMEAVRLLYSQEAKPSESQPEFHNS